MKIVGINFIVAVILIISASGQETEQKFTAEAIRLYPALAQKDSQLNKSFVALYQDAKQKNSKVLESPDWPLIIARQAASSLGIEPSGSPAPTVGSAATQGEQQPPLDSLFRILMVVDKNLADGLVLKGISLAELEYPTPEARDAMHQLLAANIRKDPSGNRILLRGYPNQKNLADGDRVSCAAVEDGVFTDGARTYHAYRWVPIPPPAPAAPTSTPQWKPLGSALDKH